MNSNSQTRFACDAMLGSLARWLRAAGYDAFWREGIDDRELVRLAQAEGRTLLSSDTGIFLYTVVRDGVLPALFLPHKLSTQEQLAFVFDKFDLAIRPPRCMVCGGELAEVNKEQVEA